MAIIISHAASLGDFRSLIESMFSTYLPISSKLIGQTSIILSKVIGMGGVPTPAQG